MKLGEALKLALAILEADQITQVMEVGQQATLPPIRQKVRGKRMKFLITAEREPDA